MPDPTFPKRRFLVLAALAFVAVVPRAEADPTSPFSTASGTCPTDGSSYFSGSAATADHPSTIYRLATTGGPGGIFDISGYVVSDYWDQASVLWGEFRHIGVGESVSGSVSCDNTAHSFNYTFTFFDRPIAPVSFSGTSGTDSGSASALPFIAPGTGQYVASLNLSGGAVTLRASGRQQTFASSGQFDMGTIDAGDARVTVSPLDGPQAIFTVVIQPLPVVLSGLGFGQAYSRSGEILTASYTTSGDTRVSAFIRDAAGAVVRTLAVSLPVGLGAHNLTWDGLDGNGAPLPDGIYTLRLDSADFGGHATAAEAQIALDSTPPDVRILSKGTITPSQATTIQVSDALSGIAEAILDVDGESGVARTGPGQPSLTYKPEDGWSSGSHSLTVTATDRAGNKKRFDGRVVARRANSSATRGAKSPSYRRCKRGRDKYLTVRVKRTGCVAGKRVARTWQRRRKVGRGSLRRVRAFTCGGRKAGVYQGRRGVRVLCRRGVRRVKIDFTGK